MKRFVLVLIIILATVAVCASVFEVDPQTKPRKLTPAEQRESITNPKWKG